MNAIRAKIGFTVESPEGRRVFEAFGMSAERTPGRSGVERGSRGPRAGQGAPTKAMRPRQRQLGALGLFSRKINLRCGEKLEWEIVWILKTIKPTEKCRLLNTM